MEAKDFDDKGYSCFPVDALYNEDWKTKPKEDWTMQDQAAHEFQEMCRVRDEVMDRIRG